jgi:hypothetical protein
MLMEDQLPMAAGQEQKDWRVFGQGSALFTCVETFGFPGRNQRSLSMQGMRAVDLLESIDRMETVLMAGRS